MSKRWYIAKAVSNGDLLLAKGLREKKFAVHVAKTFEAETIGGKAVAAAKLRLPGYIFAACNSDELGQAKDCRGFAGWLVDGAGKAEPLYPGLLEKLRADEDRDFEAAKSKNDQKERLDLQEWDEVEVSETADHPVAGEKGFYMGVVDGEARVLIGMMKWPVNLFDLKKVEKKKPEKKPKPKKRKRK